MTEQDNQLRKTPDTTGSTGSGASDDEPEFLGYHDDDPERRKKTAPLYLRLKISPTTLPGRISRLYVHRLYSRRALEERREKAFDAFGRPGRGLRPLSGSFDALSEALGWGPQLRARRLADDWPDIVGPAIAAYTRVASYRDGEIVVIVSDPSWTQILRSMESTILGKVNGWMAPTVVSRLVFRGRGTGSRTRGGLRVPRKGVRTGGQKPAGQTKSAEESKPVTQEPAARKPHNGWSDPGAGSASPASWGGGWG